MLIFVIAGFLLLFKLHNWKNGFRETYGCNSIYSYIAKIGVDVFFTELMIRTVWWIKRYFYLLKSEY